MDEDPLIWEKERIVLAGSCYYHEVNRSAENRILLNRIRGRLNRILRQIGLIPFNNEILIFTRRDTHLDAFVTPFLNLISISNSRLELREEDLLWLIMHEKMHIIEAELFTGMDLQNNEKINYFNEVIRNWLEDTSELMIRIDPEIYREMEEVNEDLNYSPALLMQSYSSVISNGNNFTEGIDDLARMNSLKKSFYDTLNQKATLGGRRDSNSPEARIILLVLTNWKLHSLYTQILDTRDFYWTLSQARAIYFSSVILGRDIEDYRRLFGIDRADIYEANRLKRKYGSVFKLENFRDSIMNQSISEEARNMKINDSLGDY